MTGLEYTKRCIVTGAAGFIGSALTELLLRETGARVLAVDKLTYAGVPASLKCVGLDPATLESKNPRFSFLQADICDGEAMRAAFARFKPDTVFHLAAESHVDRSIDGPGEFVRTNVEGTATLLQAALEYWRGLPGGERAAFRFHHVSTDEVYGALGAEGRFAETSPYAPRSPYSATKAAADHLVRAWRDTYGLPVLVTNCSNNFGPRQFPEKLVPLAICNGLEGRRIPLYGDGGNVRDWIYVEDHARALLLANAKGAPGETYNIGADNERTNLQVARAVCAELDALAPLPGGRPHESLVEFTADRPGHDFRYAVDASKLRCELGWKPRESFETGMRKTVEWYLANAEWLEAARGR